MFCTCTLFYSPYASLGKDTSWKFSSRKRERLALDTTDSGEQSTKKPKAARSWDKDGDDIPDFLEKLWDNSERESVGLGCLERIFGGGKGSVNDEKRNKLVEIYWHCKIFKGPRKRFPKLVKMSVLFIQINFSQIYNKYFS